MSAQNVSQGPQEPSDEVLNETIQTFLTSFKNLQQIVSYTENQYLGPNAATIDKARFQETYPQIKGYAIQGISALGYQLDAAQTEIDHLLEHRRNDVAHLTNRAQLLRQRFELADGEYVQAANGNPCGKLLAAADKIVQIQDFEAPFRGQPNFSCDLDKFDIVGWLPEEEKSSGPKYSSIVPSASFASRTELDFGGNRKSVLGNVSAAGKFGTPSVESPLHNNLGSVDSFGSINGSFGDLPPPPKPTVASVAKSNTIRRSTTDNQRGGTIRAFTEKVNGIPSSPSTSSFTGRRSDTSFGEERESVSSRPQPQAPAMPTIGGNSGTSSASSSFNPKTSSYRPTVMPKISSPLSQAIPPPSPIVAAPPPPPPPAVFAAPPPPVAPKVAAPPAPPAPPVAPKISAPAPPPVPQFAAAPPPPPPPPVAPKAPAFPVAPVAAPPPPVAPKAPVSVSAGAPPPPPAPPVFNKAPVVVGSGAPPPPPPPPVFKAGGGPPPPPPSAPKPSGGMGGGGGMSLQDQLANAVKRRQNSEGGAGPAASAPTPAPAPKPMMNHGDALAAALARRRKASDEE